MNKAILLQDLTIGQEFVLLNKRGVQKTNSSYVFMGKNKTGSLVDYEKLDGSKFYASMFTKYNQYVELV